MTLPIERTNAILETEKFLYALVRNHNVPADVREHAIHLIRHYPNRLDIHNLIEGFHSDVMSCPLALEDQWRKL